MDPGPQRAVVPRRPGCGIALRRRAAPPLTDQARELYEAQAAAYRNTVLQAFQDVEDNFSSLRILDEETAVEAKAVAAAQRSFNVSNQRYKGGVTSYLEVLTAEDTLLSNQRTLTDLETRQFAGTVLLIRALGGGWDRRNCRRTRPGAPGLAFETWETTDPPGRGTSLSEASDRMISVPICGWGIPVRRKRPYDLGDPKFGKN